MKKGKELGWRQGGTVGWSREEILGWKNGGTEAWKRKGTVG